MICSGSARVLAYDRFLLGTSPLVTPDRTLPVPQSLLLYTILSPKPKDISTAVSRSLRPLSTGPTRVTTKPYPYHSLSFWSSPVLFFLHLQSPLDWQSYTATPPGALTRVPSQNSFCQRGASVLEAHMPRYRWSS